jgi:superfamily I DNA and/or RNA helicase
VEAGAEAQRRRRLKTVGVVGSTCCAALTAEALQGNHFDVVVLDEAAQVVESLALAPILRSGCRCPARSLQHSRC